MSRSAKPVSPSPPASFQLTLDMYCDLLGGASWEDCLARGFPPDQASENPCPPDWLKDRFSRANQFLISGKISCLCPLEALWLKWHLFSDLCRAVLDFQRSKKKPHFNISPQQIRINIPHRLSESAPARWMYPLALDHKKASRRFSLKGMPPDWSRSLFVPARKEQQAYQAPVFREMPLGYKASGMAAVRSIEKVMDPETSAGEKTQKISGVTTFHFVSEEIRQTVFSKYDAFFATLYFYDENDSPIEIWASQPEPLENGLLLKGAFEAQDAAHWEKFEHAGKRIFSHAEIKIYRAYHVPCDLYSVGMLLLRVLLVNDLQDMKDVSAAVQNLAQRLEPMVQGVGPEDEDLLIIRFQAVFDEYSPLFSKSSVLFSPGNQKAVGRPIPDALWAELIIFAFRLITFIPGFSFCESHGDFDIQHPDRHMGQVVRETVGFADRIKSSLFGPRRYNDEIRDACDLIRKELAGGVTVKDAL